ncbi:FecR family protein [Sphingobium sp.]|uniref:FecR family protein n=1 Tax=Sphingobium sp. TaxID=1912891 RepID=UPI003B3A2C8F
MTISNDPLGQDALIAEASRWLAALDAGTADAADFEAWRRADPARAVAYARVAGQWETIAAIPAPRDQPVLAPAPAQASTQAPTLADAAPMASRRQWLRAAAVGLPLAIIGSGFVAQRAYAWDNATTGVGETRRVALPDGSIAYLNTDTSLSWRFSDDRRALRLDRGEVALDLRGGNSATFHADAGSLPLTPGLFDARITGDRAELTLVDGAAMPLRGAAHAAALQPNQSVIVDGDGPHRVESHSSEQIASRMAWRAGEIIFLDQSVADAAADFNRYLPRKIVVADATLAQEKIGGRFDLARPDQFLKAVSLSLNAQVTTTPDGYRLAR